MFNIPDKTYFITGAAGFIGFYLSKKLLDSDCNVIGVDNLNDYYDVNLRQTRLNKWEKYPPFACSVGDISNKYSLLDIFETHDPNIVVNLAAQAGVRYSLENPNVYMQSNVTGFFNILEAWRQYPVDHLIYASSSS